MYYKLHQLIELEVNRCACFKYTV